MTVKELKEALSLFPEDKEVVIWTQKGFISYDEADYWCGCGEVNCIEEISHACDRSMNGKIKLEYLTDEEAQQEKDWYDRKRDGEMIIKTKSGITFDSYDDKILNELKKEFPIDLITEEERQVAIGLASEGYLQSMKYIRTIHPELGLKEAKIYYDLYLSENN